MSLVLCLQLAGGESVGDSKPMVRTVLCGCGDSCGKDGRRPDLGLGTYQATFSALNVQAIFPVKLGNKHLKVLSRIMLNKLNVE